MFWHNLLKSAAQNVCVHMFKPEYLGIREGGA